MNSNFTCAGDSAAHPRSDTIPVHLRNGKQWHLHTIRLCPSCLLFMRGKWKRANATNLAAWHQTK